MLEKKKTEIVQECFDFMGVEEKYPPKENSDKNVRRVFLDAKSGVVEIIKALETFAPKNKAEKNIISEIQSLSLDLCHQCAVSTDIRGGFGR